MWISYQRKTRKRRLDVWIEPQIPLGRLSTETLIGPTVTCIYSSYCTVYLARGEILHRFYTTKSIDCIVVYLLSDGAAEYCSGYTDKHGQWNNGFFCPKWGRPDQVYCCGPENHRYCCTIQRDDDSENFGGNRLQ